LKPKIAKVDSVFDELAKYRQNLGLPSSGSPEDKSTIAKLEIGDKSFFGVNSSDNPYPRQIKFNVNPITKTHAEADAFQQAYDAGIRGGKARLIVDRDLCAACGLRGRVNSIAWQLGIEELEIIAPSGSKTIIVQPPKTRRK
jgi:MafB19-like deaminase